MRPPAAMRPSGRVSEDTAPADAGAKTYYAVPATGGASPKAHMRSRL